MRVASFLLVALICGVFAQADQYEFVYPSTEEAGRIVPYIEFNSFEGSYTSDFLYGTTGMHICVDRNNQLSGSYDEIGLLQGFVENTLDEDGNIQSTATGNFYEAGTGTCVTGTFELNLTSWGFSGFFNCGGAVEGITIEEVRTNAFRPCDDQCKILDRVSSLSFEGSWENKDGYPLDGCLTDTEAKASYLRRAEDAKLGDPLIEGYFEGVNFLFGKVSTGTWYEEEAAGPIIYFIRNTGNLEAFRWSGLLGDKGRTVIDPTQIKQEEKHQNFEWESHYGDTKGKECNRFSRVKNYLLENLPQDDDDFYYFVNDDYFDAEIEPVNYLIISSDASVFGVSALLVAFFTLI